VVTDLPGRSHDVSKHHLDPVDPDGYSVITLHDLAVAELLSVLGGDGYLKNRHAQPVGFGSRAAASLDFATQASSGQLLEDEGSMSNRAPSPHGFARPWQLAYGCGQ
jgi:hypothetical protein